MDSTHLYLKDIKTFTGLRKAAVDCEQRKYQYTKEQLAKLSEFDRTNYNIVFN